MALSLAQAQAAGYNIIRGTAGDDHLSGTNGNDYIKAGAGNDTVVASNGNDIYLGGSGTNSLDFSQLSGNLTVNIPMHTAVLTDAAGNFTDYMSGFQTVTGTSSGLDTIIGSRGADTFISGGADNTVHLGMGNDTLVGGTGADTMVVTRHDVSDGSVKTFVNFTLGQDSVDLSSFMKGQTDPNAVYQFQDLTNADGSHSTMVQALYHGHMVNVVNLSGVNVNDVGYDHHHLGLADLTAATATGTIPVPLVS